jgi:hypothetical protein
VAENADDLAQETTGSSSFGPQESTGHKLLLDAADANLDRDQVRQMLWLLNAPPDIDDIAVVLRNLSEVLEAAETYWPDILDLQNLGWLSKLLGPVLEMIEELPALPTSSAHGSRDWLERNALYCAIRTDCLLPPEYRPRYRLLQAHYFFAHTSWLQRNVHHLEKPTGVANYEIYGESTVWPALTIDPYHAGLCVRDMAMPGHLVWGQELLDKLPVTKTPRELPDYLDATMVTKHKDFQVQKKVNYLSDYLLQIYGVKDRLPGHGSSPASRLPSEIGDPEDPLLNLGTLLGLKTGEHLTGEVTPLVLPSVEEGVSARPTAAPNSGETMDPLTSDVDTDDDERKLTDAFDNEEEEDLFAGSLNCDDPLYERSPGSFSGRCRGAVNQLIRQQKMFPFAIERLGGRELPSFATYGIEEIYQLSKEVKRKGPLTQFWWRSSIDTGLDKRTEVEVLRLLLFMLWTGSDVKRAASLIVARDKGLLEDEPLAILVDNLSLPYSSEIRIRAPFPKYSSIQAAAAHDCLRTEFVWLPDVAKLRMSLPPYNKISDLGGGRYRPFPASVETYQRNVRLMLKALDPSGRLTANKITGTLFARIMSLTGNDAVSATMITGTRHRLSSVAMHYACREVSILQETYKRATLSLLDEINVERFIREPKLLTPVQRPIGPRAEYLGHPPDAQFVGRRLCPQTDIFRQAVHNLIETLNPKPYSSSSESEQISYHNRYTFYTIWMFALATGIRKLITPYVDVHQVSPINGVVKLRDKDGDSGVKAKLGWIPDLVCEQMRHYADHLKAVRERFHIQGTDLPCFFLEDDRQIKLVRPKTMHPFVSTFLPGFPVDIHRRFMFNALLDAGCRPEVVRIWMGHAVVGEEWWRDDATFSHQDYRLHLVEFLVPVIEYLGFTPIKGFAAQKQTLQQEMINV